MTTPENRNKHNPDAELSSQPKLDKAIQSKRLLETTADTPEQAKESKLQKNSDTAIENKKPTAVKAKAAKPPQDILCKSEELEDPKVEQKREAVDSTLPSPNTSAYARLDTGEIANQPKSAPVPTTVTPTPAAPAPAKPTAPAEAPDQGDHGESSSEDEAEVNLKAQKVLKQKEAHARYMRFYRSLRSTLAKYAPLFFHTLLFVMVKNMLCWYGSARSAIICASLQT